MKIAARYYTRSGNTKKLADAIADAVGTTAKTTAEPLTEDMDILFLGSSVKPFRTKRTYAGRRRILLQGIFWADTP